MQTPRVEELEVRRLLFAGTEGDDVIRIMRSDAQQPLSVFVEINGVRVYEGAFSAEETWSGIPIDALGGNDLITTDPFLGGRVDVSGGDGSDTIVGGHRGDTLLGNGGADLIFGKNGPDTIVGGAGADTIRGGNGSDTISGDADPGNFYDGTTKSGHDLIFGEAGVDDMHGGAGNDTLRGGADADTIIGADGNDHLYGEAGDDEVWLARHAFNGRPDGAGNDFCDGGLGIDRLNVNAFAAPMRVTLNGLADDGLPGEAANVTATFEDIRSESLALGSLIDASASPVGVQIAFSAFGVAEVGTGFVSLIGSEFDDVISGGGHSSTSRVPHYVEGRGGNDYIQGVAVADMLLGGDGDDTIDAGVGDDTVIGGAGNDSISGYVGNDMLVGDDGNDTIDGGEGNDRIAGGVGNDVIHGDVLGMTADWGSDTIEGNAGHDFIMGGGHNEVIEGHGGRDTIIGGGSNDRMYGGPGVDKIIGGPGDDSAEASDEDIFVEVETFL
ncbi:MAG TPA: calcium-binding protein [Tepidisphaeraceae bacterium]|nr:calcium-binding protein [Tepidisphaeraceae bacterium]